MVNTVPSKFSERLAAVIRSNRRLFVGAIVALATIAWAAVGASAWFVRDIVTGLPENTALRDIGTMAQATTLYDVHDAPAFTIFREQRIDVPLSRISPNLVHAIIAV